MKHHGHHAHGFHVSKAAMAFGLLALLVGWRVAAALWLAGMLVLGGVLAYIVTMPTAIGVPL